jgi:hypothetical protein
MQALLVSLLFAGTPAPAAAPQAPAPEAAIKADDIRRDIGWLADPARTGRGVGTPGNAASAAWIADQMKAIGLAPAFEGGYQQPFEAPIDVAFKGDNRLQLGKVQPVLRKGWQPFTFSDNGSVKGELVWAGYGISAKELDYDDYAGLDVKGKIVLVAAHFPRETDQKSPFRSPKAFAYGEWRYKAMNARDHGAVAILGVRDDWHHPAEGAADKLPGWNGAVASRAGLLSALVTISALRSSAIDPAALGKATGDDGKPHSKALGIPVELAVGLEQEKAQTANVAGVLRGKEGALAGECVVIGAHFDHLGMGGEASLAPDQGPKVHPGADDNASGTSSMLAIARAFAAAGPQARTMLFVAFSGEELGLLGSAHYVKNPSKLCPNEKTQLMVNLDMVGRPKDGKVYVYGVDTAEGLRTRVEALVKEPPALALTTAPGGDGYGPSDHTSFYAKDIPVLFFFTGAHTDYHRPTDTADKIDAAGDAMVAQLAFRAARDAAGRPERLKVAKAAAPAPGKGHGAGDPGSGGGYGAYFGSIPDFAERTDAGVLVSGVRPGSPAEKAGIAGGDIITQMGESPIKNLYDLTYALRAHRPGDVVEVAWEHGGKKLTAKVTLGERP